MTNWIKIDNNIFFIKESNVQLSIGSHAHIEISIDLTSYPQYLQFFFNLFQNHIKFELIHKQYESKGTLIKSVDYDYQSLHLSLRCDYLSMSDISDRRDEIIEDIINNQSKNNIN